MFAISSFFGHYKCVFRLTKLDCIKTNKFEINCDHKVQPNETVQGH